MELADTGKLTVKEEQFVYPVVRVLEVMHLEDHG